MQDEYSGDGSGDFPGSGMDGDYWHTSDNGQRNEWPNLDIVDAERVEDTIDPTDRPIRNQSKFWLIDR